VAKSRGKHYTGRVPASDRALAEAIESLLEI
jgi:hypothetical protein